MYSLRLISEFRHVSRSILFGSLFFLLLQVLTTPLIAISLGQLTGALGQAKDVQSLFPVLPWVLFVAAALAGDQVFAIFQGPFRERIRNQIDEGARTATRKALGAGRGIEIYDDQSALDDAFTVSEGLGTWTYGQGVEAIPILWSRIARIVLAAIVVAQVSILLGIWVFATTLVIRELGIYWHRIGAIKVVVPQQPMKRELHYWLRFLGGPQAAREMRSFDFAPWAVGHQHDLANKMNEMSFLHVLGIIIPKQWWVAAVGLIVQATTFGVMVMVAMQGAYSIAEITAALAAIIAVQFLGGGEEPFALIAAQQVALARDRLGAKLPVATGVRKTPLPVGPNEIVFDHVSFTYPGRDQQVLESVSFTIQPGEKIAIVGQNGAGKSTIIKLLAGLYLPTGGEIRIDGIPLQDLAVEEWRRAIAAMVQDTAHFPLSLRDNVGLSSDAEADDAALGTVLGQIGLESLTAGEGSHADSKLSRQYSDGIALSGGQWQRIALARVLFAATQDATVAVMDEPTAHLDMASELSVFLQMLEILSDKTVIFFSHRFGTVRAADRILVLEDGRIMESGTHDALMKKAARYAQMYRSQSSVFEDNDA